MLQKLTLRVLVKLGIRIEAYYWTQEGLTDEMPPGWDLGMEGYSFSAFHYVTAPVCWLGHRRFSRTAQKEGR